MSDDYKKLYDDHMTLRKRSGELARDYNKIEKNLKNLTDKNLDLNKRIKKQNREIVSLKGQLSRTTQSLTKERKKSLSINSNNKY